MQIYLQQSTLQHFNIVAMPEILNPCRAYKQKNALLCEHKTNHSGDTYPFAFFR